MRYACLLTALFCAALLSGEPAPPQNAAFYFSRVDLIASDEVQKLAPDAKFSTDKPGTAWNSIKLAWPGTQLAISRLPVSELPKNISGFQGYAYSLSGRKMDQHVYAVIQKIGRTNHVFGITAEPGFDAQRKVETFLSKLAEKEKALVFFNDAICAPDFRVILGPENVRDKTAVLPGFDSAMKRRERSIARLRNSGVPVLESLPPIAADEETSIRPTGMAARRCAVLAIVAARGEGLEKDKALALIQKFNLGEVLSPKERAFLSLDDVSAVRAQFTWRYECVHVLLWAFRKVELLDIPKKPCDAAAVTKAVMEITEKNQFDTQPMRTKAEILDQLDLIYRCHWATRNATVKKVPPPQGVNADAVEEWHYVLNWLIHADRAEWDDVQTGT